MVCIYLVKRAESNRFIVLFQTSDNHPGFIAKLGDFGSAFILSGSVKDPSTWTGTKKYWAPVSQATPAVALVLIIIRRFGKKQKRVRNTD